MINRVILDIKREISTFSLLRQNQKIHVRHARFHVHYCAEGCRISLWVMWNSMDFCIPINRKDCLIPCKHNLTQSPLHSFSILDEKMSYIRKLNKIYDPKVIEVGSEKNFKNLVMDFSNISPFEWASPKMPQIIK